MKHTTSKIFIIEKSQDDPLQRIISGCSEFNLFVTKMFRQNPHLLEDMSANEHGFNYAEAMAQARLNTKKVLETRRSEDPVHFFRKVAESYTKQAEINATYLPTICDADEISNIIPDRLKQPATRSTLRSFGAHNLVKYCITP